MKLPVAYIFHPAQEFTVRVVASAQELAPRRQPVAEDAGGRNLEHCATHNKRRWRAKFNREFLQMEAA